MLPGDVKSPMGDTERRRYRHRGPTLRSLVRLAQRCDSASQLGEEIRRRYDRQRQPPGRSADQAELAERLDQLLVQD